MLDTKTFLTRVTAQPDDLVITIYRSDRYDPTRTVVFNEGGFTGYDEAVARIAALDAQADTTVYYAVGKHRDNHEIDPSTGRKKIRRTKATASWFRSLAVDIDIGDKHTYKNQRDGWRALNTARQAIGLPIPLVVSSGYGLHCYWPLTQDIPATTWEKVSIMLRLALADHGVEIDTSKVHDTSMVLRPVGTHNKKKTPWVEVQCMHDAGPYDVSELAALNAWRSQAEDYRAAAGRPAGAPKRVSAVAAALSNSHDVDLTLVALHCQQVQALLASGGATDATGAPVQEPLWRLTLGLAKHAIDPQAAVIQIAGGHPDFDLQANLNKMSQWAASGPPTCTSFEQACPGGCQGCPKKGTVKTPASLSYTNATTVPVSVVQASNGGQGIPTMPGAVQAPNGGLPMQLPPGYVMARLSRPYPHVCREDYDADPDDSGATPLTTVAPFEMHITAVYSDVDRNRTTAILLVNFPNDGWKEFELPIDVLATVGKDFVSYMLSKLIILETNNSVIETRKYLMRYIDFVQQQAPVGADFDGFGWQKDGSFLCGHQLLGSPTGNQLRRLSGPAKHVGDAIMAEGDRNLFVQAMSMLDDPCANNIAAATLLSTAGILGKYSGNSSFLVSIYSTETTTGKSLALASVNALIGRHRSLLLGERDTSNAVYKMRGVLNQLPATMDELTMQDPEEAVSLAYNLSQGREKLAMDRNRDLRDPVTWDGPTIITTNHSMHQKFDEFMSQADPVKARTLELHQHDREFIQGMGGKRGTLFYQLLEDNHGFAYPELVQAVLDFGGARKFWEMTEQQFESRVGFRFEPQERFYRSAIISAWGLGKLGKTLGLFPFDVDRVIKYLCDQVKLYRKRAAESRFDAFDIVGQFLSEHNDRIIVCREQYASGAAKNQEQVQFPVPELAVARMKIVYDANNPVMPGSVLSINQTTFKKWLSRTRDSLQRVSDELMAAGALVAERERVTIYKGCQRDNPGQAFCTTINLNHPRFVDALTATKARGQSPVTLAVLKTGGSA